MVLPVDVEERTEIYTPMTVRSAHVVVVDAIAVGVALLSPPTIVSTRLNRIQRAIARRRIDPDSAVAAPEPVISNRKTGEA